jgi:hypothetical protein
MEIRLQGAGRPHPKPGKKVLTRSQWAAQPAKAGPAADPKQNLWFTQAKNGFTTQKLRFVPK